MNSAFRQTTLHYFTHYHTLLKYVRTPRDMKLLQTARAIRPTAAIVTERESKPTETQATTMSDFALPDNVKEVISRLPVKDQGEHIIAL